MVRHTRHRIILTALLLVLPVTAQAGENNLTFEHVMNIGSDGTDEGQFKYIEDIAFTKDGHLVATDASHAWVQVFSKAGAYLARFGGKGDDDHGLDKPEGIAVDPDGNIFVADYITGNIKKYDSSYRWVKTFSEYGPAPGQNMRSEFMHVAAGRLYLAEAGNHRIDVFDLDGNFLFNFGTRGTAPGQFNTPEDVQACGDRLYVSDLLNDRIQVFDFDGKFLTMWGRTGSAPGEFRSPAGLTCDDADGRVYVTEIGNSRIQVFDGNGGYLGGWGRKGSADGEFENIHGLAVDQTSGTVYVADTGNSRIQVFRPVAAAARAAAPMDRGAR